MNDEALNALIKDLKRLEQEKKQKRNEW